MHMKKQLSTQKEIRTMAIEANCVKIRKKWGKMEIYGRKQCEIDLFCAHRPPIEVHHIQRVLIFLHCLELTMINIQCSCRTLSF
jgi:hypothetical protein